MAGKRSSAIFNLVESSEAKAAFAYRLSQAMAEKGWNQSEMARQAEKHLPKPVKGQKQGHGIGRDLVSNYVRGLVLPRPAILTALAKALGCREAELLAPASVPSAATTMPLSETGFTLQARGGDRAYLEIRREMPMATAMKIVGMLNAAEAE